MSGNSIGFAKLSELTFDTKTSLSTLFNKLILSETVLNLSYSSNLLTNSARGSSSSSISSKRGRSIRDLISANIAAINKYSPASSRTRSFIKLI